MKQRRESADDDLVRLYLAEIGRHPLLTKDQEVELAQAIETATEAAAELEGDAPISVARKRQLKQAVAAGDAASLQFVQANLRLVVSIAKRYQASGVPLLDLVQEGNLGLIHAVEKFDWRKGFKFSTYATWWIRQAITRGIANTGRTIRVPVHAGDLLTRLQRVRFQLTNDLGRPPSRAELAVEMGVTEAKVEEVLRYAADVLSLSEPLRDDGDAELADIVADQSAPSPFDAAAEALLPREVAKLLGVLDERERTVIQLRFGLDRGEPRTLEEVGDLFDLTRERIRQIEAKALSKLRHPAVSCDIASLLSV